MESTSSAIIPEKRLDFNNVSMYLFILPLSGDASLSQGVSPVLDLYDRGTLLVTKGASLESITFLMLKIQHTQML